MKKVFYSLILSLPLLFIGCADAGKDQVVSSSTTVTLDGSSSTTAVNGKIKKYKWKQLQGKKVKLENKNSIKASFLAPNVLKDTKLVFRLITVEKGGYISPLKTEDRVKIIVEPQTSDNIPPIALIQASKTSIKLNESISLDASTSSDSDGTIISYEWTNNSGEIISSDKVFEHTFSSVGNHTITLKVTDDGGLSSTESIEIIVNDLINPIANIVVNSDTINISESVIFDASNSSDADGEIVLYTWKDNNSNILSYEKIYTHTFDTQGQYPITLIVEDDDGLKHSAEVNITVQAILSSIELSVNNASLEIGDTTIILATANYNDNSTLDITEHAPWSISDNSIISIDNIGTITALKSGIVTIQTTIEDISSNIVTIEVSEPIVLQSIKISPNPITLRVDNDAKISIKGVYSNAEIKDIEDNITYEIANTNIISFDGVNTITGLEKGETTLKISVDNISSSLIPIKVNSEIITTNFDFTNFGTKYVDQIPANATKEKYDEKLFCMLTGNISDIDGNPIEDIKVSIYDYLEYGTVQTKADGSYVIASEGGRYLTLRYEKTGYTTIDRKVYAQAEDWSIAPDVTMLKIDEKVTSINLSSSTPQIHSSTVITDDRGSRATTLVFSGVTSATIKSPDGSTRTLASIDVRATEFKTPESMPSDLPIESAYTYCSDLIVDGVKDDETVEFNAPVIMYVDNFLGFEVGEIVPIGYYDRNKGEWVGSKNGAVIQLLDTNNDGKIDALDSTGDGQPNDLDEDGSFTSEVKGIEDNYDYQVGMTYWRGEITHFTPLDYNWPVKVKKDVKDPKKVKVDKQKKKNDKSECTSSYINIKERVYHEDIDISGTNLTLHYTSKRVDGYKYIFEVSKISIPHVSAKKAVIKLNVAGKIFEKELNLNNFENNITFEWDGKDKIGKIINTEISAFITYQVNYEAIYTKGNSEFEQAWAQRSSISTSIRSRNEIGLSSITETKLNMDSILDYKNSIANGWSLSNHNRAMGDYVQKGDGTVEKNDFFSNRNLSVIKNPNSLYGDNWNPKDLSFGNDDNLYFVGEDNNVSKIIKFDPLDNFEIIAGEGNQEISDGLNAKDTKFNNINNIATDAKGNIYFIYDYFQIKKIDTNGIVSTFAGTGEGGFSGDKGLAKEAKLGYVADIEFDNKGNMYIIDNSRVRKIDTNGIITTIVGSDTSKSEGDGDLAINASLFNPINLAIDSKENIYILEGWKAKIRKIDTNGIITRIAGTGERGYLGDGSLAKEAKLDATSIDVDLKGNIYLSNKNNQVIRFIDSLSSIITTIINKNLYGPNIITVGKNQDLYIGDIYNYNIYKSKIEPIFNINFNHEIRLFKNKNNTADIYNIVGRHLRTIDLFSKNILKEFIYDTNGRVVGVKDNFENEITITRDTSGYPTVITASNGQKTYLDIDSNGDLVNISYEDNSKYTLEYIKGSLLSKTTFPNNGIALMNYDNNGRIIEEIDPNNAKWKFGKKNEEAYIEYLMTKPEGDIFTYKDYVLENGYEKSENITPCGDIVTITTSGDEKNIETVTNEVKETNSYITDIKTNQKVLEKSITTQPSGLKRAIEYKTDYIDNEEDVTLSKTQIITINSKAIVLKNDYENAINIITTSQGRVSKSEYDINTKLTSKLTTGTLTPTTYTYDTKGRVSSQTTGTRTITYTYNNKGNIDTVTNARNKTTSYQYDILDRVTKITHPNGAIENYSYDISGNITKLVTPISTNHDFTYDAIGQRKSMNSPLNKSTTYTYNGNRKLTKVDRPSGKTLVNTYVNDKLSTTVTNEATTTYDYIFNNKIGTITKGTEKVNLNYDGDLLTSLVYTGEINQTLSYTYNNDFLPTSFTYAGKPQSYTYDNDNLTLSSGDYTFTRDVDNAYVTKVTDGKLIKDLSYDNYGELTKVSDNTFTYEITSKDDASLILQKKETINNITNTYDYKYDDNSRLTEVKKDNTIVESYSYDNNGNRLSATVNNLTTIGSYTLDDQVEVYGNNTYKYDEDGYLKEKVTPTGTTTYNYSTLGELKEVITPTKTITYLHNASNQRVAKLVDNIIVEKYLWANLTTLLAIYDKDDNLIQRFTYANSRMPISMMQDSTKYYLHYNQVGSLRAVTDTNHNIIKEIIYDTYGNILIDSNESFKVPFGFAGGLYDEDTKLTRFGYRDYDSYTGKWTAKDPIDFGGGDSNLYGYVLGDPVNFFDSDGLMKCPKPKNIISFLIWGICTVCNIQEGKPPPRIPKPPVVKPVPPTKPKPGTKPPKKGKDK